MQDSLVSVDSLIFAAALTHLPSGQVFGVFVEVINVGAEGLEVRDDKLLPEGLGEQNDVALNTSKTEEEATVQASGPSANMTDRSSTPLGNVSF